MKKIKNLFSTPKKAIITICLIVAAVAIISTGTVFAVNTIAESNAIDKTTARNYALADAGIAPEDANFIKTDFCFEDGQFVYEVKFTANGKDYEYIIKSDDGTIISKDVEISDKKTTSVETADAENSQTKDSITLENAKEKALKDAGLSASEVTFKKTKLDNDDGELIYDIDFCTSTLEYEYEIDSITGDIISKSTEKINNKNNNDNQSSENTNTSQATENSNLISANLAKEKALKDAGLSASEVTFTKVKLDKDDGIYVYEIDFQTSTTEYDYEINGKTGAIIEKSTEKIYNHKKSSNSSSNNSSSSSAASSNLIGLKSAKEKALNDAGLSASDVTFTKSKLDKDDGIYVYEIDFYSSTTEYDYEINGKTGAIIEKSTKKIKTSNNSSPAENKYIGVDKAKSIAVNHAGLSLSQVTFTKAKLDNDDGETVYEIEFFKNHTEYEYTIDAINGKILEHDSEIDD